MFRLCGSVRELARRTAQIWREIAPPAGIAVEQEGLFLPAQRIEAMHVIEAFAATEMAGQCSLLSAEQAREHCPMLQGSVEGALVSGADLRVESRTAIPLLAKWLEEAHGIAFLRGRAVNFIETGCVHLANGGSIAAEWIVACPGDDWAGLFPADYESEGITRCQLQMLRLADPGWRLPNPVMSDLSMDRYLGYSELSEAGPLMQRLALECPEELDFGIHLIAVQSADGSLVVGDSHVYAPTPEPFASTAVEDAILRQYQVLLGAPTPVVERWTGTYASGPDHSIVRHPMPGVTLVVVTSGTGASTGFALAEETISHIFGE